MHKGFRLALAVTVILVLWKGVLPAIATWLGPQSQAWAANLALTLALPIAVASGIILHWALKKRPTA